MLSFRELTLSRGGRVLLQAASFTVQSGQRLGLVGANGVGKSSLLALVTGRLDPDSGTVEVPRGWEVVEVEQDDPGGERSALDFVLDGDPELRRAEADLAEAQLHGDAELLAGAQLRLEAADGYSARPRAARLLSGLGFPEIRQGLGVSSFSGGWRRRLALARALFRPSDLLLLDEPTNHLDLDAVVWLEGWLARRPGTLIVISHDRDFLDRTVTGILHVEGLQARAYRGNYSAFEAQRTERLTLQAATHRAQAREIERLGRFVQRFRAKATKARQVQSRLRVLERMERAAPVIAASPLRFAFARPRSVPRVLLRAEGAAVGYGAAPILEGIDLSLHAGERLGLVGPNGAGKSTLIKLLAGELSPCVGRLDPARDLTPGYFAQHRLDQLDLGASALEHLRRADPTTDPGALRAYLGGFGFSDDRALVPCATFSGGERARLALALLVRARPNLLLLDEPTNHLDLDMRQSLTLALQPFPGTVVVVSHDRALLQATADRLLVVGDGRVSPWPGSLDDYVGSLTRAQRPLAPVGGRAAAGEDPRDRRRRLAAAREAIAPLRRAAADAEGELERTQAEHATMEARFGDPRIYDEANRPELERLLAERTRLERSLAEAEAHWISAQEALEAAADGS